MDWRGATRTRLLATAALARRCAKPRSTDQQKLLAGSWKTLVSITAYHSFGGEVEASNTLTIRHLIPSRRPNFRPQLLVDPVDQSGCTHRGTLDRAQTAETHCVANAVHHERSVTANRCYLIVHCC